MVNIGGVEVVDGVVEIHVIDQVGELGAELNAPRFGQREAFDNGEVHVRLSRPGQRVATNIDCLCPVRQRTPHRSNSANGPNGLGSVDNTLQPTLKIDRLERNSLRNIAFTAS